MNSMKDSRAGLVGMLLIAFSCCGFTWGASREDRCAEARKIGAALSVETPTAERTEAEKTILKLCPDGGVSYYLKGLSLEAGRNLEGAVDAYRKAGEKDPLLADAKGRLGLLLLQRGAREEASVALFEALKLQANPRYSRALAEVFLENELYALALHHFRQALPALAGDVAVQIGMARSYRGLGERARARDALLESLRLEPGNVAAHLELAGIYQDEKLYDQAAAQLGAAISGQPANRDAHFRLAQLLELMGKQGQAEKEYLLAGVERSAVDSYKDAITVDGKVIAFPWRGASYYTYYNKKLFEKAGVPTPDTFVKAAGTVMNAAPAWASAR